MEKIKVLIANSDSSNRSFVTSILASEPEFDVVGECFNEDVLLNAFLQQLPDLVLMDTSASNFAFLESIKATNSEAIPFIIFISDSGEHAPIAFEHGAVDYLIKPFTEERLLKGLQRVRQLAQKAYAKVIEFEEDLKINSSEEVEQPRGFLKKLLVKHNSRIHFISVEDINYIESEGKFVRIHTGKETKIANYTFKQLESLLDPRKFVRVHKSFIVNIDKVESVENYFYGDYLIYTHNTSKIRLSRNFKDALQLILHQY